MYELKIEQHSKSGLNYFSRIICEDLKALRKAFEQTNSKYLFGEIITEEISEDWEADCHNEVVREKNNWTTRIATYKIVPVTFQDLQKCSAFSFELSNCLLYS